MTDSPAPSPPWRLRASIRRLILTLLVAGQTVLASWFLLQVLPYHGGNLVEWLIVGVFALLYLWIAFGFWIAVYGFLLRLTGGDRKSLLKRHSPAELEATELSRTAIVMPLYHEPVAWTLKGLKAIYLDLERSGRLDDFDFFILSDSQNPNVWLEEQQIWRRLVEELGAHGRLFYRRRRVNLNFKSGNVADFLRRWGSQYQYMVVLDADSLLAGETIRTMVQVMNREPRVGILQTAPTIINGRSAFARIQQFASRLYSPLFATGLAAIQMGDAAFWGHNAIIRIAPFMAHCGLPKLKGVGIWRGPIMSHDFVEAAFLGRAGQNRTEETGWREASVRHLPGLLIGGAWSAFAWTLDPMFFFWSLPVSIPLMLAAPTTVWLSRLQSGEALARKGLLLTPEEQAAIPVLDDARRFRDEPPEESPLAPIEQAVLSPVVNKLHCHLARKQAWGLKRSVIADELEECIARGYRDMDQGRLSLMLEDAEALATLHRRAWSAAPDSFWGRRVHNLVLRWQGQSDL